MDNPTQLSPADVAAELVSSAPKTEPAPPPVESQPVAAAPAPTPSPIAKLASGGVDSAGIAFDQAKHSGAKHPRTGRWLPRGGRKPKSATAAGAVPPAHDPSAESAWSTSERAAAATPTPEPAPAGEPGDATAPVGESPEAPVDHSTDAAEAVTNALYLVIGALTGAPDEAQPAKTEHANMTRSVAAYIRSTGWRGGPLAGAILALSAYLLRTLRKPKSAAAVETWLKSLRRKPEPKNVTPAERAPDAPANAAPRAAAAPVAAVQLGGWTERAGG